MWGAPDASLHARFDRRRAAARRLGILPEALEGEVPDPSGHLPLPVPSALPGAHRTCDQAFRSSSPSGRPARGVLGHAPHHRPRRNTKHEATDTPVDEVAASRRPVGMRAEQQPALGGRHPPASRPQAAARIPPAGVERARRRRDELLLRWRGLERGVGDRDQVAPLIGSVLSRVSGSSMFWGWRRDPCSTSSSTHPYFDLLLPLRRSTIAGIRHRRRARQRAACRRAGDELVDDPRAR